MFSSLQKFHDLFNNHKISILSEIQTRILLSFRCFLITKDNFNKDEIFQRKINSNLIIIDQIQDSSESYLVICFDKTIILISESDLSLLNCFFDKHKESETYILTNSISKYFTNFKNHFKIPNYLHYINIYKYESDKYKKNIVRCILVYFIETSLQKADFDRIKNCEQNDQPKTSDQKITTDEYVTIEIISKRTSTTHKKIYLIPQNEIVIQKYYDGEESEKLFNRERSNYANLVHPLLPKYYGYTHEDGKSILIEYIRGHTLEKIIDMDLTIEVKYKIIFEIMILIEYLHSKHYIYRDLKKDNFLIDPNKTVVLIDFDRLISNDQANIDESHTNDFNHCFVAPEIFKSQYSYEVDIYSLGLVIYFVLFEKDPKFFKDKRTGRNKVILNRFPEDFSKLEEIVRLCIQIDPSKRPKISEIIDLFYFNYFSKIPNLVSEIDSIQSTPDIHDVKYRQYWTYIAEYNNYYSQIKLAKLFEKDGQLFQKNLKKSNDYYFQATRALTQSIENQNIRKLYLNFKIVYNDIDDDQKLLKFLSNFKFLTYYFPLYDEKKENTKFYGKAVICGEETCLIFDRVDVHLISKILKKSNASLVDVTKKRKDFENEDVDNFCRYYHKDIDSNEFLQLTIRPISAFIIRRHFCPTNFFKNPIFFSFDPTNIDPFDRRKLNEIFFADSDIDRIKIMLRKQYEPILFKQAEILSGSTKIQTKTFLKSDFISLKHLDSDDQTTNELAIHIPTSYVFMVKRFNDIEINKDDFNKLSVHDSFVRLYGFLEENGKVKGLVYEYMSNGLFVPYKKEIGKLISLSYLIRLFHALEYILMEYPNHRMFELSDVYLDHDNIPYVSYSFIPRNDKQQVMTQQKAIKKFGEFVYSLFEKKEFPKKLKNNMIPPISNCSDTIKGLYTSCFKQLNNFNVDDIENIIFTDFEFINFTDYYILKIQDRIKPTDVVDVTYELLQLLIRKKRVDKLASTILDFFVIPFYMILVMNNNKPEMYYQIGFTYENGFQGRNYYDKAKYFYELSLSINANHSKALFHLGHLYENGKGVERDYLKAKDLYEKAGDSNLYALLHLGMLYENGCGVIQNSIKAKEYFMTAVKLRNSDIPLQIGDAFYYGKIVIKDYTKALFYYKIAAEKNHPQALLKLGKIYENGILEYRIKCNYEMAKEYYERAGQLNNSEALVRLGDFYYYGNNYFKHDFREARKYYEKAAELQNSQALFKLGIMYKDGYGVSVKDVYKSNQLFAKYAELQSGTLMHFGLFYENGYGVEKDYSIAKEYYELSIELNGSSAIYHLGLLYKNGNGVPKDLGKAKELLDKFTQIGHYDNKLLNRDYQNPALHFSSPKEYFELFCQNNSEILLNLGTFYKKGEGAQRSWLKAKKYYELSSGFNNSNAFYCLGHLYEKGNDDANDFVGQDYAEALNCYLNSIKQNNTKALYHLGNFYEKGLGVEKNEAQALHYFELSANQNYLKSYFRIGRIYFNGIGVDVKIDRSISNFTKCIRLYNELKSRSDEFKYSVYNYLCNNYLGLIYVSMNQKSDTNKIEEFFRKAGMSIFSYGQNNLGLFYQFYKDQLGNAKHLYHQAEKQDFALAAYNLGYLYESDAKIEKAIQHYSIASEIEDKPLKFQNKEIDEDFLPISKTFILCLTNLKLTKHYLSLSDHQKAGEYFVKVFSKLINDNHRFSIKLSNDNDENSLFAELKYFILNFSEFNLPFYKKVVRPNTQTKRANRNITKPNILMNKKLDKKENDFKVKALKLPFEKVVKDDVIKINERFDDPKILFNYAVGNDKLKIMFLNEIDQIISEMVKIVYQPPFLILFGRMNSKNVQNTQSAARPLLNQSNVNRSFYQGFGFNKH